MTKCFEARIDTLAAPQKEIWPLLAPAARLSFVLYGGTAVALHLGVVGGQHASAFILWLPFPA